jgi:uncharacterized protein (DUF1015 family)
MVDIRPFKGVYYNPNKVNLPQVVTPPYDVISEKQQEIYYNRDPHNIIRIILGKEASTDTGINNKYTRARNYIDKWLQEKVLQQDTNESIYIYRQKFIYRNKSYILTGIISLVKLEDLKNGNIYPHEETLYAPKLDRYKLMEKCEGNVEFIYTLYSGTTEQILQILHKTVTDTAPFIEFKDEHDITHQMWRIIDKNDINKIIETMKDESLLIADGHHRYEATFKLKTEKAIKDQNYNEEKSYNYIMMLLISMNDQGLIILPTYRVLRGLPKINIDIIKTKLSDTFEIIPTSKEDMFKNIEQEHKGYVFGLYIKHDGFYILKTKDEIKEELIPGKSEEYQKLDVVVLHSLVINRFYPKEGIEEDNIAYIKDEKECISLIDSEKYQLALFLAPVKLSQLKALGLKREKLPQKSTYFWPKPVSGMLLYLWTSK